jgi:hypothetical protein
VVPEVIVSKTSALWFKDLHLSVPDQFDAVIVELLVHAVDVPRFEIYQLSYPAE